MIKAKNLNQQNAAGICHPLQNFHGTAAEPVVAGSSSVDASHTHAHTPTQKNVA